MPRAGSSVGGGYFWPKCNSSSSSSSSSSSLLLVCVGKWLDKECHRLRSIRGRLVRELAKYDIEYKRLNDIYEKDEKKTTSSGGGGGGGNDITAQGLPAVSGSTPLYRYKLDVHELYGHLRKIRPKIAQKLLHELGE